MVQVLVDLAAGTILDEETAENTEAAHPDDLAVEVSEYVPYLPHPEIAYLGIRASAVHCARARVHGDGLSDDETICNELADGLAGVGIGDLAGLIGIEPDLALSTTDDGRREALLGGEIDPIMRIEG